MYDFSKLNESPEKIFSILRAKGNTISCTEDIQIVLPKRFDSREFNLYNDGIQIMGIFAFVDTRGNYAVHNIPNRINVSPSVTETVIIDDEPYIVMTFYAGDLISMNTTMVASTAFLNSLYNEFIVLGKVPKYFSYTDLITTFKNTSVFNASPIGQYNDPIQLLISLIAKDADDKTKPFRLSKGKAGKPGDVYWVGLSNVHYTVSKTLNKIGGGYASQSIYSAVDNNDKVASEMEDILLGS